MILISYWTVNAALPAFADDGDASKLGSRQIFIDNLLCADDLKPIIWCKSLRDSLDFGLDLYFSSETAGKAPLMWMEQMRQRNCAVSEMIRHSMSNFVHPTTRVSDDFKLMYNSFVEPFLSLKLHSGKTEIPYLARRLCTHSDGSIIWGSTLLFEVFLLSKPDNDHGFSQSSWSAEKNA